MSNKSKIIGIYDVDSKIPNLALMKISAWHKERGDDVEMYFPIFRSRYDDVYASKIFNFSSSRDIWSDKMKVGGTGWDISVELPEEMEAMSPDYTLYNYPHSIGFTMRGCRLKCSFCVVPQKEGGPKPNNTIEEIWTQRDSRFIMLLDNDFFGNPEWSDRIEEMKAFRLKVNFSQGLNIRNLKPEQAAALESVQFVNSRGNSRYVYFAWDDPRHEKLIHKGIQVCVDAGIKAHQMAFFVLIGYHSTPEEDLHRVEVLRKYGCMPFAMPYNKFDPYQKKFCRWVNRKELFKSCSWSEFSKTQTVE